MFLIFNNNEFFISLWDNQCIICLNKFGISKVYSLNEQNDF